jgi:hypothetical protein
MSLRHATEKENTFRRSAISDRIYERDAKARLMYHLFMISVLAAFTGMVPERPVPLPKTLWLKRVPAFLGVSDITTWFTISDAPHFIELDWRAAAVGVNNSGLMFWIGCNEQAGLSKMDNDTLRIGRARLGCSNQDKSPHPRNLLRRCLQVAAAHLC